MSDGTRPWGSTVVQGAPDEYALKDLERAICEDDRVTELGIRLDVRGGRIVVRGHLLSSTRRDEVLRLVREGCPDREIVDETTRADGELSTPPMRSEEIR